MKHGENVYITSKIVRISTSFNKSDGKSKKLEEQSKSGDAREIEQRRRNEVKMFKFTRARNRYHAAKYATVLRAPIAKVSVLS